jgi:hypothetical protein
MLYSEYSTIYIYIYIYTLYAPNLDRFENIDLVFVFVVIGYSYCIELVELIELIECLFRGETFHLCSKHFSSLLVKKELFVFATDFLSLLLTKRLFALATDFSGFALFF